MASVVVGESEANKGKQPVESIELARVLPSYVGQGLLKCARHWRRGARVCPSRSVVIGARLLAAGRATPEPSEQRFLFFLFLSCGGALLMTCAPCSALCARLDAGARLGAVCATRRCVRGSALCVLGAVCAALALLSIFLHHTAIHGCISLPCKSGSSLFRLK